MATITPVCVFIYILSIMHFLIAQSIALTGEDCARRTKSVHCTCDGGYVYEQHGVQQCFDHMSSSCRSCSDENTVCARRCLLENPSRNDKTGLMKSRRRRGILQCIFEDGIARGNPVINSLVSRTVYEGIPTTLFCNISSNPSPTKIQWIFKPSDGPPRDINCGMDKGDKFYVCTECDQKISFDPVLKEHEGQYTCVVENVVGRTNKSAQLTVNKRPSNLPPIIKGLKLSSNSGTAMYIGRSVNLTCQGFFGNQVTWFEDGQRLTEDDWHIWHQPVRGQHESNGILEFKKISFNDSGVYVCRLAVFPGTGKADSDEINLTVGECPGRYFCSPDNNIEICPSGNYCTPNSFAPTPCPMGTYCPKGSVTPQDCPEGFNCPDPSVKELDTPDDPRDPIDPTVTAIIVACVLAIVVVSFALWYLLRKRYCSSQSLDSSRFVITDVESTGEEGQSNAEGNLGARYEWDVFICYSSKDGEWVRDMLVVEIEKRGLTACIDIRDFIPGEAIVQNIVDAIYGSRKTVAVLSPNYVKSDWCKDELQRAITRGINRHQVVPILYKPCKVPRLLLDKTYLDWTNEKVRPHFWDLLEKALQADLRISAV